MKKIFLLITTLISLNGCIVAGPPVVAGPPPHYYYRYGPQPYPEAYRVHGYY